MQWSLVKSMAAGFVHRKDINWDELQPLALDQLNTSLVVMENESFTSLVLAPSSLAGFFEAPLPADFARPRAVFNGGQELTSSDIQGMISLGSQGMTRFFAVSGLKLVAAVSASLALVYSTRIPVLAADTDHSWLSDRYSNALLYALLCQAVQKIQDFDALQAHQAAYDQAVGEANAAYAFQAFTAGAEARTPYGQVSN